MRTRHAHDKVFTPQANTCTYSPNLVDERMTPHRSSTVSPLIAYTASDLQDGMPHSAVPHLCRCQRLGRSCLDAAQVLLGQLFVHNLQRLVVQACHARLVARAAVARLAHARMVQVDRIDPQPRRAEVRAAIPCTNAVLNTFGLILNMYVLFCFSLLNTNTKL